MRSIVPILVLAAGACSMAGCTSAMRYRTMEYDVSRVVNSTSTLRGRASYYHDDFEGRRTASGELFQQGRFTAAHLTLPLGTRVRVINLENGRSTVVRINDRGPHVPGRIIDLTRAAATELGMIERGTVEVELQILDAEE
jgi:rare lipoprotein A